MIKVSLSFGLLVALTNALAKDENRAEAKGVETSIGIVTASDSISLLSFEGSLYLGDSKAFNLLGIKYSSEWFQLFITDHPSVKKATLFAGHQFRMRWHYLFLPVSLGISGGAGIDRGAFIRSTREDSTCFLCHSDYFYEKRKFIYTGLFLEITPSLYFRGFHIGLKYSASIDTRHMANGGGLDFGFPIEEF